MSFVHKYTKKLHSANYCYWVEHNQINSFNWVSNVWPTIFFQGNLGREMQPANIVSFSACYNINSGVKMKSFCYIQWGLLNCSYVTMLALFFQPPYTSCTLIQCHPFPRTDDLSPCKLLQKIKTFKEGGKLWFNCSSKLWEGMKNHNTISLK